VVSRRGLSEGSRFTSAFLSGSARSPRRFVRPLFGKGVPSAHPRNLSYAVGLRHHRGRARFSAHAGAASGTRADRNFPADRGPFARWRGGGRRRGRCRIRILRGPSGPSGTAVSRAGGDHRALGAVFGFARIAGALRLLWASCGAGRLHALLPLPNFFGKGMDLFARQTPFRPARSSRPGGSRLVASTRLSDVAGIGGPVLRPPDLDLLKGIDSC